MVRTTAGLFIYLLLSVPVCAQGKLSEIRDATATSDSRPEKRDDCPRDDNDVRLRDDNHGPVITGPIDDGFRSSGRVQPVMALLYGGLALWALPYAAFDAGWESPAYFTPYPYAQPNAGTLVIEKPRTGTAHEKYLRSYTPQDSSFRGSVELGSDFSGLQRTGLRFFLDGTERLGLRTNWDYYRERTATGHHDFTWFGDLAATFRFVQNDYLQMHTGLGVKAMLDRRQNEYGVNALYSVEVFPIQPLHLSASVDAGTIGQAGFVRLRGEIGLNYERFQIVGGYDFMRVDTVNMYGPFVGVRVWY